MGNGWGLGVGWKWAPIGGLQYQTHMQAPRRVATGGGALEGQAPPVTGGAPQMKMKNLL